MITKQVKNLLAMILAVFVTTQASAWEPNTKTYVETTIAWPSGSGNELIFRPVAAQVEKNTGIKFTIVNKPGAGGAVGTELFKSYPADGQHINVVSTMGLVAMDKVLPDFQQRKPYNVDSFTHVLQLGSTPAVIIAHPSDKASNPQQLIDALLKEDTRMGHSGGGGRLAFEALATRIDLDAKNKKFSRVEYKGPAQTVTDVAGGHIRFGIVPASVALQFHKTGQVKIVAISSAEKLSQLPEVQTLASALPGFDVSVTWGLMLPKGAKPDVVEWYRKEFTAALQSVESKNYFEQNLFQLNTKLLDPITYEAHVRKTEKDLQPVVDSIIRQSKQ
jgi:hypothetical protein